MEYVSPDTNQTRRSYIKVASSVTLAGVLAGCLGGDRDGGDGDGGDGSGGEMTTPSATPNPKDLAPEEWREFASEKAAEELQSGPLEIIRSRVTDEFRAGILEREFSGPYEPLTGNLAGVASGSTTDIRQKYTRVLAANGRGMDVLQDVRVAPLIAEGVPFTDLTDSPSFQAAPDIVKVPPYQATTRISAYGQIHNTELLPNPPQSWDEILELPRGTVGLDYTPSAIAVAYVMQKLKTEDWIRQLEARDPVLYDSNRNMVRSTGQGEVALAFLGGIGQAYINANDGLPTAPVPDPNQMVFYVRPLAVSARPNKPWAAKLYVDAYMNADNPDIQTNELGSLSFDFTSSNPAEFIDLYEGNEVWVEEDFEGTPEEIIKTYQELVNAPVA